MTTVFVTVTIVSIQNVRRIKSVVANQFPVLKSNIFSVKPATIPPRANSPNWGWCRNHVIIFAINVHVQDDFAVEKLNRIFCRRIVSHMLVHINQTCFDDSPHDAAPFLEIFWRVRLAIPQSPVLHPLQLGLNRNLAKFDDLTSNFVMSESRLHHARERS